VTAMYAKLALPLFPLTYMLDGETGAERGLPDPHPHPHRMTS